MYMYIYIYIYLYIDIRDVCIHTEEANLCVQIQHR